VDAVSKPRTRKRGLEELAHLSDKLGPLEALFLVHAHSPNVAAQAHEVLQQTFPSRDIPIVDTNFILTMYSGPGSVATVCVQEKISEAR
jgi:fatty acid-binding protein DegV